MGDYIWPALMLWALDRTLRVSRIVWNNRLWVVGESRYSLATVELVSDDTIRLSLARRFKWRPGQHAYVILPTISRLPFEAHPFTIASIPAHPRNDGVNSSGDNGVVFLIRGRSGMTGRLRRLAARENRPTITTPALVDGPYGCPPDLLNFATCILIAGEYKFRKLTILDIHRTVGGSGISYTLPLLLNLLRWVLYVINGACKMLTPTLRCQCSTSTHSIVQDPVGHGRRYDELFLSGRFAIQVCSSVTGAPVNCRPDQ